MNNRINQIEAIKSLISTSEQQTKLLKAELQRLEDSIPKLTIHLGQNKTYVFKSEHVNCYSGNIIDLKTIYHNKIREELLYVLFNGNSVSDTYKYIYGNGKLSLISVYEMLKVLKIIYQNAIEVNEKERIKAVYNIVLAKNMYVVNFMNSRDAMTEVIIKEFTRFYKDIYDRFKDTPNIGADLSTLLYLVNNKLSYTEVYDKIIIDTKKWMLEYYTCMYTIE